MICWRITISVRELIKILNYSYPLGTMSSTVNCWKKNYACSLGLECVRKISFLHIEVHIILTDLRTCHENSHRPYSTVSAIVLWIQSRVILLLVVFSWVFFQISFKNSCIFKLNDTFHQWILSIQRIISNSFKYLKFVCFMNSEQGYAVARSIFLLFFQISQICFVFCQLYFDF